MTRMPSCSTTTGVVAGTGIEPATSRVGAACAANGLPCVKRLSFRDFTELDDTACLGGLAGITFDEHEYALVRPAELARDFELTRNPDRKRAHRRHKNGVVVKACAGRLEGIDSLAWQVDVAAMLVAHVTDNPDRETVLFQVC